MRWCLLLMVGGGPLILMDFSDLCDFLFCDLVSINNPSNLKLSTGDLSKLRFLSRGRGFVD